MRRIGVKCFGQVFKLLPIRANCGKLQCMPEWDEQGLKIVLEYLQGEGQVILPVAAILWLVFCSGMKNVDESKTVCNRSCAVKKKLQKKYDIGTEIKCWVVRIANILLVGVCAKVF